MEGKGESSSQRREPDGSESPEEEEEEDYVMYKDRPEWADLVPVPQDEGEEPVVQIEYRVKFNDVYDYFRGVVKKGEKSTRVLTLTSDAILLNAANYTVWQYRRDVLEALGVPSPITSAGLSAEFLQEFTFSQRMIEDNQKNYQVWHHRKCLVAWAADYDEDKGEIGIRDEDAKRKLAKLEMDLTEDLLDKDAKNYHAWQHRQWVLNIFNQFDSELDYVSNLIDEDVRNNSAWNERYFVLSHLANLTIGMIEKDVEYTMEKINEGLSNESPWNYLRGLLMLAKEKLQNEPGFVAMSDKILQWCLESIENDRQSVPLLSFVVEIITYKVRNKACPENLYTKGLETCDKLLEKDCTRKNFWDYSKNRLQTLRGHS